MKRIYENINKTAFWICLTFSIGLIITSFVLPPSGQIDPSVLTATGEIFGFATLGTIIQAIGKGTDISLKKGDTEININNPDDHE